MKFKKDIFISYAHIDDEALIEGIGVLKESLIECLGTLV